MWQTKVPNWTIKDPHYPTHRDMRCNRRPSPFPPNLTISVGMEANAHKVTDATREGARQLPRAMAPQHDHLIRSRFASHPPERYKGGLLSEPAAAARLWDAPC